MSTAFGRSRITTRKPSSVLVTSAPAVVSLSSAMRRCSGLALRTVISPPVITAATAQVPATMRSETVRCVTGLSRSTPVMVSVDEPMPSMRAPISTSI